MTDLRTRDDEARIPGAAAAATATPVLRKAETPPAEGAFGGDLRTGDLRADDDYAFRAPDKSDGAAIWALVKKSGVLDLNSAYNYLLLGEYFSDTCRVAYNGGRLAGFVSGFVPPRQPDTLFVWQIGVDPAEQGRGLGKRLLCDILATPACGHLRYLEATVTPSNTASERLFRAIADEFDVPCRVSPIFAEDDFPGEAHEPERRFRIGPIPKVGRTLPAA
jgi:diaminobutyrate acetyltransferase